MIRSLFVLFLCVNVQNANAMSLAEAKLLVSKKIQELLGEEKALAWFNIEPEKAVSALTLPAIPKLNQDGKSQDVYLQKSDSEIQKSSYSNLSQDEQNNFNLAFLNELYTSVLTTNPDENSLATGLNILSQGGTREGVYRSIVYSETYQQLESQSYPVKQETIEFCTYYAQKFLGIQYDEQSLKDVNVFTIKRTLTEKTLDVADLLKQKPEDLYQWYGILSGELAQRKLTQLSDVRNKDENFHYEWSKKVPVEHIKSELIIKLNLVLNALN